MAVSDPSPYVATPTGTLQGVAAFSWDGSTWQPSGRAGPDVATPTGVLQGVAPFSWDGAAWQPSGRAQPGVATSTGVLDGVAVYTWSGSAWTPASGTATPSTPSGALRGVAAFSWDGAAWQPAAQARSSVATPYGVLQGVAMFEWGGSTWQAGAAVPAGATLDLSFMSGTLNPLLTFTRGSTGTYFDSSGVMQTAALNLWLQSADASNAAWIKGGIGAVPAPTVTANQTAAPDGTMSAARVAFPVVSGGPTAGSEVAQAITATVAAYTFSVWLKGSVGGEVIYIMATADAVTYYRTACTLTTAWQRFVLTTSPLTAATWYFQIGVDLRDASQTNKPAQTVFMWGGQVEQNSTASNYAPTTTVPNGAPRFDYDPVTHAALGLLIEEQRTNVWLQSADASNAAWVKTAVAPSSAPVVTGNQTVAPDGTTTAARVAYPAIVSPTGGGTYLSQQFTMTANQYTFSMWLKGTVGGERVYLDLTPDGVLYYRTLCTLTTSWQRFTLTTPALTAATWFLAVGMDMRDTGGQVISMPTQTIYAWGAQLEAGAFPTSYIPTTAAAVTRSADQCTMSPIPGRNTATETWNAEFVSIGFAPAASPRILADNAVSLSPLGHYNSFQVFTFDGGTAVNTANAFTLGSVAKAASKYGSASQSVCLNGGAVASSASGGFSGLTVLRILGDVAGNTCNGYIRRVRYWPRTLSNAELQAVTT